MWSGYSKPKNATIEIEMPNGSNWYFLENSDNLKDTSKPLGFPMLHSEDERNELLDTINIELTSPQSKVKPAAHLIIKNGLLVPVNNRGYPITGRLNSKRWGKFVDDHYNPPSSDGKRTLKKVKRLPRPKVDFLSLGEPLSTSIAIPQANNEIEAEYFAKAGFIEACVNNQWLLPYANRLGWRCHNGVSIITVPFWKQEDLNAWDTIEYEGPTKHKVGFLMSDGLRYPYPKNIAIENPNVLTTNPKIGTIDGIDFDLDEVQYLHYPKTNRKQRSVSKIAQQIREGLIPFDPPYPIVELDDAEQRIKGEIIGGVAVIFIQPNQLIIGSHNPPLLERALKKYRKLWNEGELLNDYGHATYTDSYSKIDQKGVEFLHLQDSDI